MKFKFKEILCGIALSLCMCVTCNADGFEVGTPPQITYSTILGNLDDLSDATEHAYAQYYWAQTIIDIMRDNELTRHWLDEEPANLELMDRIFDESLNAAKYKYPWLREQLDSPAVRRAVSSALGLGA